MNIVSINATHTGSTGTIMRQASELARQRGYRATSFSTRNFSCISFRPPRIIPNKKPPALPGHRYFGSLFSCFLHQVFGTVTGFGGCFSIVSTLKLLGTLRTLDPDLIHLHNLHGNYINLPLLFRFIRRRGIPVVWTLHDCWAFTGRCPHFEMLGCDRWKQGCHDCPYPKHNYPGAWRDHSAWLWKKKRTWFTGIEDMTLVTPSHWLAELVGQSFLREYPVRVIPNGIDLTVFKPTESDCRARLGIPADKAMLLGVAADWGERKGLDVFRALAGRLGEAYQIVLVGTDVETDKLLPESILSIHRTQNPKELAELYTAADIFVNPTREDNFPTTNLEALACGTPVVTFETGGSPEALDKSCGSVVPKNDLDALERELRRILRERPYTRDACLRHAARFDRQERFAEYLDLYDALTCRQSPRGDIGRE